MTTALSQGADRLRSDPPIPARRTRRPRSIVLRVLPWLLMAPALLLALTFKFVPLGQSVIFSFQKVQPFLGNEFVGLENYSRVFADPGFQAAMLHTVQIAVFQTLGATVVGLALALMLEGSARLLWGVRTAIFLPVVAAAAVVGEIWRILLYPDELGFANSVLGLVGIPAQSFLNDPDTALLWVIVVAIWTSAPYNMVIFLAGLAGVDRNLYEAAALDGAGLWSRLRYIVLPALRSAISIVLTLAAIRSLRVFTEVWVLTGGGPAGSTEVWMTRTFTVGTEGNDVGLSSAASVTLLIVTAALALTVNLVTRNKESR